MGFSSKTWGQRWAEDGTYADMLEVFYGFLQKVNGLSSHSAAAKLDPFTIFHSYLGLTFWVAPFLSLTRCDLFSVRALSCEWHLLLRQG